VAYNKTTWIARVGTALNRFLKSNETDNSVELTNDPTGVSTAGTPFTVANMNKIEEGIYNAHTALDNNGLINNTWLNQGVKTTDRPTFGGVSSKLIELSGYAPFIDFHYNNSTEDFTSRIVESSSGTLEFTNNVKVGGTVTPQQLLIPTNYYTAGNNILYKYTTETTITEPKYFFILASNFNGSVRIQWDMKHVSTSTSSLAIIYKNNVAVHTVEESESSQHTYSYDLSLSIGDTFYLKMNANSLNLVYRNVYLKAAQVKTDAFKHLAFSDMTNLIELI